MSIEGESQKDLALNTEDAENVVGGKRKAAHKKAAHHAASTGYVINATPLGAAPASGDSGEPGADIALGTEATEDC